MEEKFKELKKNIIAWYPIEKNESVLQVGNDKEIFEELKLKSNKVAQVNTFDDVKEMTTKFDYICMIGILESLKSAKELQDVIAEAKDNLTGDGKILLAMKNKFGMKFWTGERYSNDLKAFETIVSSQDNIIGYSKIKEILEEEKLKYKFYYPLPDYEKTNVIYTDECLPSNDSIDARDISFALENEAIMFSERNAYKELLEYSKEDFPFFANSFFIEISKKNDFKDVKYVSYGINRKSDYRIKTVMRKDNVYKTYNSQEAKEHMEIMGNNIAILNNRGFNCLDSYDNYNVVSKILKDAVSYDEVLLDYFNKNGLEYVIEKIKAFENEIIDGLDILPTLPAQTVFDKYSIEVKEGIKEQFHYAKDGVIDLIFQNCLYKNGKIFVYDQEWYEENVPVEFILYRAVFYFTELKNNVDINEVYKALGIYDYIDLFEELERNIQAKIVDDDIWQMHIQSTNTLGGSSNIIENYEKQIEALKSHEKELEEVIEKYLTSIEELKGTVASKDVELEDYANQLRAIANSLSWKITKPIRSVSSALHKKK